MPKGWRWLWLTIFIVALDQWSKWFATQHLTYGIPKYVLPFLNLTLVFNQGSAFGFLDLAGAWHTWLLILIAAVVSFGLIFWLYRVHRLVNIIAIHCILGGALGNLLDRLRLGYVVDFFDFHVGTWHWYIFNVADVFVCIGVFLLIYITIFKQKTID